VAATGKPGRSEGRATQGDPWGRGGAGRGGAGRGGADSPPAAAAGARASAMSSAASGSTAAKRAGAIVPGRPCGGKRRKGGKGPGVREGREAGGLGRSSSVRPAGKWRRKFPAWRTLPTANSAGRDSRHAAARAAPAAGGRRRRARAARVGGRVQRRAPESKGREGAYARQEAAAARRTGSGAAPPGRPPVPGAPPRPPPGGILRTLAGRGRRAGLGDARARGWMKSAWARRNGGRQVSGNRMWLLLCCEPRGRRGYPHEGHSGTGHQPR
jgi:hypothetical protein